MKVASSSLSVSFQVYYGQAPLHLKNDWELVFREAQLQALERQFHTEFTLKFGCFFHSVNWQFCRLKFLKANFSVSIHCALR